jgi:hypothetical protein
MEVTSVKELARDNAKRERHHELEASNPSKKGLLLRLARNAAGGVVGQELQYIEICAHVRREVNKFQRRSFN